MKKLVIAAIIFFAGLVIAAGSFAVYTAGIYNRAKQLKVAIDAKEQANTTVFDNMWKKISQSAQVTDAQKDALRDIFNGYAAARSGGKTGGSFINAVHEAIPQIDTTVFTNLQNIIVGSRDEWTANQIALVDLGREYNTMLEVFPSNFILGMFGFQHIDVKLVTSSRTDNAFKTGKDDDVDLKMK